MFQRNNEFYVSILGTQTFNSVKRDFCSSENLRYMLRYTGLLRRTDEKCLCVLLSIQYFGSTGNRHKHRRTEQRAVEVRECCPQDNKLKTVSELYNSLSMYTHLRGHFILSLLNAGTTENGTPFHFSCVLFKSHSRPVLFFKGTNLL